MRAGAPRLLPLALAVLALLLWLVLYPNLFVIADSVRVRDAFTLEHYSRFLNSPSELDALWNSVWISIASVILSAAVGVPLAFLFAHVDFPGRRVLGALVSLPVLLPPLVGVIAFLFLYGESGFFTRSVQYILGLQEAPWRLTGASAVLLVHTYTMYVYFYLFTRAALARLDSSYAEAAASLGTGGLTTLRRVTLPMLAPALGGAALLVFMTSMGSFSAPYVFGGGFRVLTTQIFASKLNGETGLMAVETVILAAVCLGFLFTLQRYEAKREYTGTSKGVATLRRAGAGLSLLATLGASAIVLVLVLPHLTVLLISFVPEGTWTTQMLPPEYTVDNYRAMFSERQRLEPVVNSMRMATIATAGNVIVGFIAAYLLARGPARTRGPLNILVSLPWALPGTVLAIALATTFSVHQPLAGRFTLVGTALILPLAYFIRDIPLVTRAALGSFKQYDPVLEEASASLGSGWFATMRRVAFPLVLPGLTAGTLLAFVTALGEFVASIVLYTHRTRPISVEILSQLRAFDFGAASAYAVLLIVLMALVFGLGQRALGDENIQRPAG